jgi:hypothetical protein
MLSGESFKRARREELSKDVVIVKVKFISLCLIHRGWGPGHKSCCRLAFDVSFKKSLTDPVTSGGGRSM